MSSLPALIRLLSEDAIVRRDAVDSVDLSELPGRYALRQALLTDPDAEVRAQAAHRLGEGHVRRAIPALLEALGDAMPSVRDRAYRALARLGARAVLPFAAHALKVEPIWWVRRAAVRAAAAVAGEEALALLLEALCDPFWRVRHAAVQALALLGQEVEQVRLETRSGAEKSPAIASAYTYLHAIWEGQEADLSALAREASPASPSPFHAAGISDEDPAVVTARLAALRAEEIPARSLVAWLGDPHAALRALARRRLRERNDLSALQLALRWLDEPRVPHAAAEARALSDRIGGDDVELAKRVLAEKAYPGALAWAVSVLVARGEKQAIAEARALCEHPDPAFRAAVLRGLVREERSLPLLLQALRDPDEDVRGVVLSVWESRNASPRIALALAEALCEVAGAARSVRERRAVVEAAALLGQEAILAGAMHEEDATLRALAIGSLSALGSLSQADRERAQGDEDPWIRAAALDAASAPRLLATDPDPWVRRAAMDWLARTADTLLPEEVRASALLGSLSPDPWIRARAAELLSPTHAGELLALLSLSRDSEPMVRASAASVLEAEPLLASLLERFLSTPESREESTRQSAYAWLFRSGDEDALARLVGVLDENAESEETRAYLHTMLLVFPDEAVARYPRLAAVLPAKPISVEPARERERPLPERASALRALGQTGIFVSPLVLSGAHGLAAASFAEARERGVNAFFWEPRYLEQTRFLRSRHAHRESLVIIGGTYNAGPASIRDDVERALRRLRADYLDVLLLFWVRSPERLSQADFDELSRLREEGKLRAFGFSTHDRRTAREAIAKNPWPVVMTRHSAAHPGAEEAFFPAALEKGTGVLTFTATCYGRLLKPAPASVFASTPLSAPDCYRYSLSQPGVSATLSAPRSQRELQENLRVLDDPSLDPERLGPMRAHGALIRAESKRFDSLIRKGPMGIRDTLALLLAEEPQN